MMPEELYAKLEAERPTCAHLDCPNPPTHRQVVRTPLMPASAFYYVCAEHADQTRSDVTHLFNGVCQAACGTSNDDDDDAPATDIETDVTCPACLALLSSRASGLLDPDDPYSYADVTIGQTQHAEG